MEEPAEPATGTVLYVEDQVEVAEVGAQTLRRIGYDVVRCGRGDEALEHFRREPDRFDVVLTDQTMPNSTGFDLARSLLEIRPDIPIVLTTGFNEQVTRESVRAAGIREWIQKPLVTRTLRAALGRAFSAGQDGDA